MASGPLTLAELARAFGLDPKDVLLYQERGLLQKPRRSPGRSGDVAYHQEHVDRLVFISRALILGFSLDAIAQLIDTGSLKTCHDIYDLAEAQLDRMRQLMGPTSLSAAILKELMENCSKTGGLDDCAIYGALTKPSPRMKF